MNAIGANQMAVNFLVKPLMKIKRKSLFVPVVFLIGNLMSLVVPSASSLAIILMSILYPMLASMGISSLTLCRCDCNDGNYHANTFRRG